MNDILWSMADACRRMATSATLLSPGSVDYTVIQVTEPSPNGRSNRGRGGRASRSAERGRLTAVKGNLARGCWAAAQAE